MYAFNFLVILFLSISFIYSSFLKLALFVEIMKDSITIFYSKKLTLYMVAAKNMTVLQVRQWQYILFNIKETDGNLACTPSQN